MHFTCDVDLRSAVLVLLDLLIEHRSVTAAAVAAYMSQPAMSRALGRLRALLRDPLLVRGSQGPVPTPAALALQPGLKRLLGEAATLVARRRFDPAAWRGQVGIAATDHQTVLLLPQLMRRISRKAPLLEVKVVDHPALADWGLGRSLALEHVLVTVLGDGHGAMDELLKGHGLARQVALRLPHFYAAMAVVAESDLVVTLPRSIAVRHTAALGLVALETPLAPPPFTTAVIWPEVLDADPGNAWLRKVVQAEASRIAGVTPR
jgi:DNA-binding transcriptional LysR family regulator